MDQPRRLLFVCLGNICRSPAAEGVMKETIRRAGLADHFVLHSAGTSDLHEGDLPDPRMRAAASARGLTLTSRSRPFRPEDFYEYDLILTMDEKNLRDVLAVAPAGADRTKIRAFAPYCRDAAVTHIPDPYYGGREGFEEVLDLLQKGCRELLAEIHPQAPRPGSP